MVMTLEQSIHTRTVFFVEGIPVRIELRIRRFFCEMECRDHFTADIRL
jgi:hypothetical protein